MGLAPFTSTGAPTIGMTDFSGMLSGTSTSPTNQFNLDTYNANQTPVTSTPTPTATSTSSPTTYSSMGLNPFGTPSTTQTLGGAQYFDPTTNVNNTGQFNLSAYNTSQTPVTSGTGATGTTSTAGTVTSPYGSNPYIANPTGNNALSGGTIAYNPSYYPTLDTANLFAKQVGGTVVNVTGLAGSVDNNQPQYMVRLANGQLVNPGIAASLYTNPNYNGHQGQIDQQLSMLLNNNAPGSLNPGPGLYTVQNGQITYNPNGTNQIQESTPISQNQYNQWVAANAVNGTPVTGLPGNQQGPLTTTQQQIAQGYQQQIAAAQQQQPQAAAFNNLLSLSSLLGIDPMTLMQLLAGGGGSGLASTAASGGGLDMNTLLQLIMMLGTGGGSGPGGLYTRSQYPMFP